MDTLARFAVLSQQESYPHLVISSRPGLGKSFTAKSVLDKCGIPYYEVNGNMSLFGFGIALAVIQHANPAFKTINILVDDCDSLFADPNSLNTMKNVLGEDGVFRYEKSLSNQLRYLTDAQREAIEHFSADGRLGYVVPTVNLRFLFTTNISLPTDNEVFEASKKRTAKSILLMHQNAIRSRCRVLDISMSPEVTWGWIADAIHSTDCLTSKGLTQNQITDISDFLWDHWEDLNERSIRTCQKMAESILATPFYDMYLHSWLSDFCGMDA